MWQIHIGEHNILVRTTQNTYAYAGMLWEGEDTKKYCRDTTWMNWYSSSPIICVSQPENENDQHWLHIGWWMASPAASVQNVELLKKKKKSIHFLNQHKSLAFCTDRNSWPECSETMRALMMMLTRISGKAQLNIKYQLQRKSSKLQLTSLDIYTKSKTQTHTISLFLSHIWWFLLKISAPCCFIS